MDAKTGEVRMDTGWRTAGAEVRVKDRAIPVAAEMEIATLAPGAYVLEVQVADDAGNVAGKKVRAFVVNSFGSLGSCDWSTANVMFYGAS